MRRVQRRALGALALLLAVWCAVATAATKKDRLPIANDVIYDHLEQEGQDLTQPRELGMVAPGKLRCGNPKYFRDEMGLKDFGMGHLDFRDYYSLCSRVYHLQEGSAPYYCWRHQFEFAYTDQAKDYGEDARDDAVACFNDCVDVLKFCSEKNLATHFDAVVEEKAGEPLLGFDLSDSNVVSRLFYAHYMLEKKHKQGQDALEAIKNRMVSAARSTDDEERIMFFTDIKNFPAPNGRALVVGAGPNGMMTAIQLWLRGVDVTIVEKATDFVRPNILLLQGDYESDVFGDLFKLDSSEGGDIRFDLDMDVQGHRYIGMSIRSLQHTLEFMLRLMKVRIYKGKEYLGYCYDRDEDRVFAAIRRPPRDGRMLYIRSSDYKDVIAEHLCEDDNTRNCVCSEGWRDRFDALDDQFLYLYGADSWGSRVRAQSSRAVDLYTMKPLDSYLETSDMNEEAFESRFTIEPRGLAAHFQKPKGGCGNFILPRLPESVTPTRCLDPDGEEIDDCEVTSLHRQTGLTQLYWIEGRFTCYMLVQYDRSTSRRIETELARAASALPPSAGYGDLKRAEENVAREYVRKLSRSIGSLKDLARRLLGNGYFFQPGQVFMKTEAKKRNIFVRSFIKRKMKKSGMFNDSLLKNEDKLMAAMEELDYPGPKAAFLSVPLRTSQELIQHVQYRDGETSLGDSPGRHPVFIAVTAVGDAVMSPYYPLGLSLVKANKIIDQVAQVPDFLTGYGLEPSGKDETDLKYTQNKNQNFNNVYRVETMCLYMVDMYYEPRGVFLPESAEEDSHDYYFRHIDGCEDKPFFWRRESSGLRGETGERPQVVIDHE